MKMAIGVSTSNLESTIIAMWHSEHGTAFLDRPKRQVMVTEGQIDHRQTGMGRLTSTRGGLDFDNGELQDP
jgi:hypothetical protein